MLAHSWSQTNKHTYIKLAYLVPSIEQRTQNNLFFTKIVYHLHKKFGFFHCHKCIEWHNLPRVSFVDDCSKNTRNYFPSLLYVGHKFCFIFRNLNKSHSKVTQNFKTMPTIEMWSRIITEVKTVYFILLRKLVQLSSSCIQIDIFTTIFEIFQDGIYIFFLHCIIFKTISSTIEMECFE